MSATAHDGRRRSIVLFDTATAWIVAGSASLDGRLEGLTTWAAGYRHGETLLPMLGRFLGEQNLRRSRIGAVAVGTGPGAFTGLRVGIATAKGIALALGVPIVGVSTADAILAAAEDAGMGPARDLALLLPAGPWDRLIIGPATGPRLLHSGEEPDVAPDRIVALDLEGRAPADALLRGEAARRGLGAALARLAAGRLAGRPAGDDPATLVPEYVTLPRGVRAVPADGVALSHG